MELHLKQLNNLSILNPMPNGMGFLQTSFQQLQTSDLRT